MAKSDINPFSEIILAKKHLETVLSICPPNTFWYVVVKFTNYLLGRCQDSLVQGSFDSMPQFQAIDLNIQSLFDDVSTVQSEDYSPGESVD